MFRGWVAGGIQFEDMSANAKGVLSSPVLLLTSQIVCLFLQRCHSCAGLKPYLNSYGQSSLGWYEQEFNRQLREEQDQAYQQSLKEDQERERQRALQREQQAAAQRAAEEAAARAKCAHSFAIFYFSVINICTEGFCTGKHALFGENACTQSTWPCPLHR